MRFSIILTCILLAGCQPMSPLRTPEPVAPVVQQVTRADIDELKSAIRAIPAPAEVAAPQSVDLTETHSKIDDTNARIDGLAKLIQDMEAKRVETPAAQSAVKAPVVRLATANRNTDGQLTVYYGTQINCRPCALWKSEGGGVRFDWQPLSACPFKVDVTGYPVFAWRDDGLKDWKFTGWYGVKEFESTLRQSFGTEPMARASVPVVRTVAAPVVVASPPPRAGYPIRADWNSTRWNLGWNHHWTHLTSGEHRGQFDSGWLASLSTPELFSLHADGHEHIVQWSYVNRL